MSRIVKIRRKSGKKKIKRYKPRFMISVTFAGYAGASPVVPEPTEQPGLDQCQR